MPRNLRQPPPVPLLPENRRPQYGALAAGCAGLAAVLGAGFAHTTRAGWLDAAIDQRIQAAMGGYPRTLSLLAKPGNEIVVGALATALTVGCVSTKRWRAAAMTAVAVPGASALTELVLKPLVDRTLKGHLSYPSGHATGAFALAAAFTITISGVRAPWLPPAARTALGIAALGLASASAVAVTGLDFHYFSDTVGGAAIGIAAVLATALVIDRAAARLRAVGDEDLAWRAALGALLRRARGEAGPGEQIEPGVPAEQAGPVRLTDHSL